MTKQFTTPCFIRKNTPELRAKLREIGWRIGITAIFREYGYLCTDIIDNEVYAFIPTKEGINVPGYIDCGTNEALLLDLAAMRSDTYANQLMMCESRYTDPKLDYSIVEPGTIIRFGEFDEYAKAFYHRATAQEIIEWHRA